MPVKEAAPLVSLQAASVSFGKKNILENVDLCVEKGRIVTLIGPNGAGKTTLVKVLLGLLDVTSGQVQRAARLRVGYMPQKLHIDTTMPLTVKRFLQLSSVDMARCQQALQRVDVGHLLDSPVQSLSGGETQRVLLARALLNKPDLLVLDEPVQGVDLAGQELLYQLIGQLRDELGCGVLMVSHDLHLVMAATDEVVCLNRHVCCHGSPQSVTENPAYLQLFGEKTTFYNHVHDHSHDLHGEVCSSKQSQKEVKDA
ncbi:zinc ABC transporter ATP-binding protein ZnuC [Porticoccus sp. GXU_MW_L64]